MLYLDLDKEAVSRENSNGVAIVGDMLSTRDAAWMTQTNSSVFEMAGFGNGFFSTLKSKYPDDAQEFFNENEQDLLHIGSAVAEFINKDYDLTFDVLLEKTRTITVEVPKVRKVGLFKKEEYIEHETKTEKYNEEETVTFKGWRLERLIRQEDYGYGDPPDVMCFDYCLGADGKYYMVVSEQKKDARVPLVVNCIFFSLAFLTNNFKNIYSTAISGVLGALDAIPIEQFDSLRNNIIKLDSEYFYNFPTEILDWHDFTYGVFDGTRKRVAKLLSEEERIECQNKYGWMEPLFENA